MGGRKLIKRLTLIAVFIISALTLNTFAEDITALESQLNAKNAEISELKNEIKNLEEQKNSLKNGILMANEELNGIQIQLNELDERLTVINEELAEAQQKEDEKKEIFYRRLVVLYEKGNTAYIEAFLQSKDIMEMSKRKEYIRQISQHDRKILNSFVEAKTEVDNRKKELDEIGKEYQSQKDNFEQKINQSASEIEDTSKKITEKNEELKRLNDEKKEIEKKIYKSTYAGKLFTEGEKYIGYPYVWGGSTPETSFDCSGFVCWTYTHSGVYNLPRSNAQQIYNKCKKINADDARAGDLIFFENTYESAVPVTHVGIYAGDGKMLHCGDPIKYASTQTPYWKSHFYGFGRLEK